MTRMAILVSVALVFVLVPVALHHLEAPPRWRVRLGLIALLGMGATLAVLLAAAMVPEVLAMRGVRQLWETCSMAFQTIGRHPLARGGSIVAGLALGWVLGRFAWSLVRGVCTSRLSRIRYQEPRWTLDGGRPVFIVPLDHPEAYAVGGGRGQVVVSRGLLAILDDGERAAVLLHEEGHLRARHQPLLAVARAVAAALRPIPTAALALRMLEQAVEEAADEYAATRVGCPATVASGLSKAALAGLRSPLGAVALGPGPDVPARIRRLLNPPAVPGWTAPTCLLSAAALLALIGLTQVIAGLAVVAAVHHLIGFASATFCPLMRRAGTPSPG